MRQAIGLLVLALALELVLEKGEARSHEDEFEDEHKDDFLRPLKGDAAVAKRL